MMTFEVISFLLPELLVSVRRPKIDSIAMMQKEMNIRDPLKNILHLLSGSCALYITIS